MEKHSKMLQNAKVNTDEAYSGSITHLLCKVKAKRFMSFQELTITSFDRDEIVFCGENDEAGKTTFILAVLLGLGYDIVDMEYKPEFLCGINLQHVICQGQPNCELETTISLHSVPSLSKNLGKNANYLTIRRIIIRKQPDFKSMFEIQVTDKKGHPTDPSRKWQLISENELRVTLDMIGINKKWHKFMLIDQVNVSYVSSIPNEWFSLYSDAVLQKRRKLLKELVSIELHIDKLTEDFSWETQARSRLEHRLHQETLLDSTQCQLDKEDDRKCSDDLRLKIDALKDQILELGKKKNSLAGTIAVQVSEIYKNFLKVQNLTGGILIDIGLEELGIWIDQPSAKANPSYNAPQTIREVNVRWERMSVQKQELAVIGLFFGFWRINSTVPTFFIDSYSSTDKEFKLPNNGNPWIILELIKKKREDATENHSKTFQQFIFTSKSNLRSKFL